MNENVERPISENDLNAYVDGRLSGARRAAVEDYLAGNPHEAARVRDYIVQRDALREALHGELQERIPDRLRIDRIRERLGRTTRGLRLHPALTIAATFVFALGLGAGWLARDGIELDSDHVVFAVGAHRVFVADAKRPVEIRADQRDQLQQWLSNRLERTVSIPDLSAAGLRFMGGRLIPTPDGPAAQLMYDDDRGTRVTLFVESDAAQGRNPWESEIDGVDVVSWATEGFRYTLAADSDRSRIANLGAFVRTQLPGPNT
jgi:anti-sigma factor RsiW